MNATWRRFMVAAILELFILPAAGRAYSPEDRDTEAEQPVRTREQIQADWLRQDVVRTLPARRNVPAVRPEEDAPGACDGVRNGKYGFHTANENDPWWQVDLLQRQALEEVRIFNRCDGSQQRALHLKVLLSDDGKSWKTAYQHDGTLFLGHPDNQPLSVALKGDKARFLRIQLSGETYLHLDEVEIYSSGGRRNIALGKQATQSSASPWSTKSTMVSVVNDAVAEPGGASIEAPEPTYPIPKVVRRGLRLAESVQSLGAQVNDELQTLREVAETAGRQPENLPPNVKRDLYFRARWAVRRMATANPLLDFDDLLLVKRTPSRFTTSRTSRTYTHMCDQYYGWFSRPGGGLYVLKNFKSENPELRCLTENFPPGNMIRPELSYDGGKVLFAYCKYYPHVHGILNKLDKSNIPEDAFYHLYEMNTDGSAVRRITKGKYDDFDGRYLPNGDIVFLSTRRGQHIQCGSQSAMASMHAELRDSYVRCGGSPYRPVAVYTLHVMDADGNNLRQISPFEMFEWTPGVAHDGRILYARWDYIDRYNMPYMSLWSTLPDGTGARAIFGNYTSSPHCIFEPREIPNSNKIVFTASAHHGNTAGSLVLLDPDRGFDGEEPMTRLTPEVSFPEVEAWPNTYFANPYPLSEEHYLVTWSDKPLTNPGDPAGTAAMGIYLFDRFGNLNMIYRDPAMSSMYPLPIRPRPKPRQLPQLTEWSGPQTGEMVVLDVYQGLESIPRGTIHNLRLVGVPAKTHPTMNYPVMGVTHDDPGKFVMGTVPVEKDGSACFRVPSGVIFFLQALDERGMAVQTMRSATYVQPGEQHTCIGCHEPRHAAPPNRAVMAVLREPSEIAPGPVGSWPFDFETLVQPVVAKQCVSCHKPDADGAGFDLTSEKSYDSLVNYGEPSLKTHVMTRYRQGFSTPGACAAKMNPLIKLLDEGHYDVELAVDEWNRLITWLDTYGQRRGSFGADQEERLRKLRRKMTAMQSHP
ncbi:MAG: discoidin domain-containing protein [Pirellulaceae bacterium]